MLAAVEGGLLLANAPHGRAATGEPAGSGTAAARVRHVLTQGLRVRHDSDATRLAAARFSFPPPTLPAGVNTVSREVVDGT